MTQIKIILYFLNDYLLRFYYSYIHKNKSALEVLGSEAFYNTYIEPTIHFYISKRFEEICRTYFSLQVKQGNITGVYNIGTYYYDDSLHKTNGEFDVVLQRENAYDFYEVKFLKTKMKQSDIKKEVEQINSIQHLPIGNIGFISINGFEKNNSKYHLIDGKMLFKK